MVRLGWMQDSHINADGGSDPSGSSFDALWQDINTLDHTYNVEDLYFTGDLVAPDD
jgi:hypothetical protein